MDKQNSNIELNKLVCELKCFTQIKVPDYLLKNDQFSCLRTSKEGQWNWRNLSKNETNPLMIKSITEIIYKLRNSLANLPQNKKEEILKKIRENTPFYYQMANRNFIPGVTEPIRSCRITSLAMALHALGVSAYDLVNKTDPGKDWYVDLKKLMNMGNWLAENYSKSPCKLYNNVDDLLNERFPDFLILLFIYAFYDGKIPDKKEDFLKKIEMNKGSLKDKFLIQPLKKTLSAKKTLTLIEKICGYFGVKHEGRKFKYDINKIKTEMNQGKEILLGWWTVPKIDPNSKKLVGGCSNHTVYLVGFDKNSKFIINDPGTWQGKHTGENNYNECRKNRRRRRYRYYEVLSRNG